MSGIKCSCRLLIIVGFLATALTFLFPIGHGQAQTRLPDGVLALFSAFDARGSQGVWLSDGEAPGTSLAFPDVGGNQTPIEVVVPDGVGGAYLQRRSQPYGHELLHFSGETGRLAELGLLLGSRFDGHNHVSLSAGRMIFAVYNLGYELWVSDGTAAGTAMLRDRSQFPGLTEACIAFVAQIEGNRAVVAIGDNSENHYECDATQAWVTDGTAGGTQFLFDFLQRGSRVRIQNIVTMESDRILVSLIRGSHLSPEPGCSDHAHREIWAISAPSMQVELLGNFNTFCTGSDAVFANIPATDELLFMAYDFQWGGERLFRTDGTPGGTVAVRLPQRTPYNFRNFTTFGDHRVLLIGEQVGGGRELYLYDRATDRLNRVRDITPGAGWTDFRQFVDLEDGRALFIVQVGQESQLWVTNGTYRGTRRLLIRGGGRNPTGLRLVSPGIVMFSAETNGQGVEPWITDGTWLGTNRVRNIAAGSASSSPTGFTPVATSWLNQPEPRFPVEQFADWSAAASLITARFRSYRTGPNLCGYLSDFNYLHGGTDIGVPAGTTVLSPVNGEIVYARRLRNLNRALSAMNSLVVVRGYDGIDYVLGHMECSHDICPDGADRIIDGERYLYRHPVTRGQPIGTTLPDEPGFDAHLHLGVFDRPITYPGGILRPDYHAGRWGFIAYTATDNGPVEPDLASARTRMTARGFLDAAGVYGGTPVACE